MLLVCEDKSEINMHKIMDEVSKGRGKKWEKRNDGIYWKVSILLEKTEKKEVSFKAIYELLRKAKSFFSESGVYEGGSGYNSGRSSCGPLSSDPG